MSAVMLLCGNVFDIQATLDSELTRLSTCSHMHQIADRHLVRYACGEASPFAWWLLA